MVKVVFEQRFPFKTIFVNKPAIVSNGSKFNTNDVKCKNLYNNLRALKKKISLIFDFCKKAP
jgi:hypothetical protein